MLGVHSIPRNLVSSASMAEHEEGLLSPVAEVVTVGEDTMGVLTLPDRALLLLNICGEVNKNRCFVVI